MASPHGSTEPTNGEKRGATNTSVELSVELLDSQNPSCDGEACKIRQRTIEDCTSKSLIQSPWSVEAVDLQLDKGEILIRLESPPAVATCPECGKRCARYDSQERRWRHLDTCQYQTILVATIPRIKCDEHGVRQVRFPWAEQKSRFTALLEALVIDLLRATENIAAVAKLTGLNWEQVDGIRARAVARGSASTRTCRVACMFGVVNAATSDFTNAMSESINSHIQRIKKRACGFRSRTRFRNAILFHLGVLDLYPDRVATIHSNH